MASTPSPNWWRGEDGGAVGEGFGDVLEALLVGEAEKGVLREVEEELGEGGVGEVAEAGKNLTDNI